MRKINLFFESLSNNIEYVLFKNYDKIEKSLAGDFNFDLSISFQDRKKFETIAKDFNLLEGINIYDFLIKDVHHYFLFDENRSYHLHVHYGLILGTGYIKEYIITVPSDFYNSFIYYKGIKVLSEPYYTDIQILRNKIKNTSLLGKLYLKLLKKKKSKIGGQLSTKYFIDKNLRFSQLKNFTAFALKIIHLLITVKKKGKKYYKSGLTIGICGTDGSGKTTISNSLFSTLNEVFYVKKLTFGRLTPNKSSFSNKKSTRQIFYLKKITAATIRLFISYKILLLKKLNFVVITDRYYNINGPGMDSFKITEKNTYSKIERFIYSKVPKIDLTYTIEVALNTAIERNHSRIKYGKETKEEIIARYKEFQHVKYWTKRNLILKNDGSVNEAINHIFNDLY